MYYRPGQADSIFVTLTHGKVAVLTKGGIE